MSETPAGPVRPTDLDPSIAARLKRDRDGLVVAVAQQHDTGEVLMVGWMDDEALHRTLTTGRCTYWSRSRQEYWVKGDTSGHQQWVKSVALDCGRSDSSARRDTVHIANVLGARGFDVVLRLRPGGHDYNVWRPALTEGLEWASGNLGAGT